MNRRNFLRSSVVASAATAAAVAAPHVVSAQAKTFNWKMTNAYGPGAPFYVQVCAGMCRNPAARPIHQNGRHQ
jgi:TRAP-type mannitol/chloroaromatic compound transport system substrate-binding protein